MSLDLIRKYIQHGLYNEARRLIDIESDIYFLMYDDSPEIQNISLSSIDDAKKVDKIPLLIVLALIKDEEASLNLSRLLLEKGYHLDISDKNGLCAMNYAIALNRTNLVKLYLSLFNVELNLHEDFYKNSLIHYVFAMNNAEIIRNFSDIYTKFYEWDTKSFMDTKNCDGLSVQDLFAYSMLKNNTFKSRTKITNLPEYFANDSNPINICNFINKVYNSNSTIQSELLFVTNTARILSARSSQSATIGRHNHISQRIQQTKKDQRNREFKLNLLYQVRSVVRKKTLNTEKFGDFNEIIEKNMLDYRNNRYSPINNGYHKAPRMMSSKMNSSRCIDSILESPILSSNFSIAGLPNDRCWRTDFKKIYVDYEVINSESYCKPAVPLIQWDGSQSGYLTDFTKDGSEYNTSRVNSALESNCQSNLSDLFDSGRKLKKNNKSGANHQVPISLTLNTHAISKKMLSKLSKQKSVDIRDDEESSTFGINFTGSDNSKKSKKKLANQKTSMVDLISYEKEKNQAKVVKPSGPSKWSALTKTKRNSDSTERSLNSHDS